MNERVKLLRITLGLSQEKFGEKLGVGKVAISLIERGVTSLTERNISSICHAYCVSENWLRTGEGEMFTPYDREDILAEWFGEILKDDEPFKKKFISMLARMTTEEWKMVERKVLELAGVTEEEAWAEIQNNNKNS